MTDTAQTLTEDTVWEEREALIDRILRWIAMTFLFVVVVAIWDTVTRLGWVSAIILPTPAETLDDLVFVGENLIAGGYMLEALWTTTIAVAYGFLIATGIGFSLGVLVGETKFGERAVAAGKCVCGGRCAARARYLRALRVAWPAAAGGHATRVLRSGRSSHRPLRGRLRVAGTWKHQPGCTNMG